jgi:hypothetical protein
MQEPNHQEAVAGDALYEWLLSDHPDARAERDRRREATYQDERERTGKVLGWVDTIRATPHAPESMRELAETMGPLAAKSAEAGSSWTTSGSSRTACWSRRAPPRTSTTTRPPRSWPVHRAGRRAPGPGDDRYPDRYTGPDAASQPRPNMEPEPEATPDEPEITN